MTLPYRSLHRCAKPPVDAGYQRGLATVADEGLGGDSFPHSFDLTYCRLTRAASAN